MADENYIVLLFSAITTVEDCQRAFTALSLIGQRAALPMVQYPVIRPKQEMSVREAVFAAHRTLPVEQAVGEICGGIQSPCPPCIPIVMPGERIDAEAAEALRLYGVRNITVLSRGQ